MSSPVISFGQTGQERICRLAELLHSSALHVRSTTNHPANSGKIRRGTFPWSAGGSSLA
jgi:hypothetical protein